MMNAIFHLAFPVHDIEQARMFYIDQLGCEPGRASEHAMIFKLGQHQLVAHKTEAPLPVQEGIYPRHFGLVFLEKEAFDAFLERIKLKKTALEIPLKVRYPGTPIEHYSFFLKDPSNNLLEFKHYTSPSAIFGENDCHQVGELGPSAWHGAAPFSLWQKGRG